jgi:hypothetical protein
LQRWEVADRIRVTDLQVGKSYLVKAEKASRETDFYRMESPNLDPSEIPPLWAETILGHIEGAAVGAIDAILSDRASSSVEIDLAIFIAVQFTRGRAFRHSQETLLDESIKMRFPLDQRVAKHLATKQANEDEMFDFLKELHAGEIIVREQKAVLISRGLQIAMEVVPQLLARHWMVVSSPLVALITCDEPVVILEGPDASRRERGGIGTADIVIFPLSPEALLMMVHPLVDLHEMAFHTELDAVEASEVNLEIAANSNRCLFERGDRSSTIGFPLPPRQPASTRHGPYPLADEPGAELYRWSKPSRWNRAASPPPLPVRRWWWQPSEFQHLNVHK